MKLWPEHTHTHAHGDGEGSKKAHHWDEAEEGGSGGGRADRLVHPPLVAVNDGTSVTGMTAGVAGLFARPPARHDGLDRRGGWRLRRDDRPHFHFGEKSGKGGRAGEGGQGGQRVREGQDAGGREVGAVKIFFKWHPGEKAKD